MTMLYPQRIQLECGPVRAIDLALYAAASGDHNALHLDAAVAEAAGFERPVVHGMLTMAYAARLFTCRFGACALRSLSTRFVGVAKLGDTITLTGSLAEVVAGVAVYTLTAVNDSGAELVAGRARVSHRDMTVPGR